MYRPRNNILKISTNNLLGHTEAFPVLLLDKQGMKNSGKIRDYFYIHPLCHIQILAQSVHYSSKIGFPDYLLIIFISISFQFYYRRSRKRKIMEKSQSIATYVHYIIYKFQLNPFTIIEVINFLQNFQQQQHCSSFSQNQEFHNHKFKTSQLDFT